MGRPFNGKKRNCYQNFDANIRFARKCINCTENPSRTDSCRILSMVYHPVNCKCDRCKLSSQLQSI